MAYYQNRDFRPNEKLLACLQICKGFNDVVIQNIHKSLLGVGFCNSCGPQKPRFRVYKCVPLSILSLTLSHAALVVVGSERGSNEASTIVALRWSFRKESILQRKKSAPIGDMFNCSDNN